MQGEERRTGKDKMLRGCERREKEGTRNWRKRRRRKDATGEEENGHGRVNS